MRTINSGCSDLKQTSHSSPTLMNLSQHKAICHPRTNIAVYCCHPYSPLPFTPSSLLLSVSIKLIHPRLNPLPPAFSFGVSSPLCLVIVSFCGHVAPCLAFTQLLNHRFDSPLSVCFAPSSASSQSPADDPRKSCCFSLPAYIIPTYSYVILCNVFAAAATFKTISLAVRLYAEMNRVKWIVLTTNEQKCVCYYHRGICSHHNCTSGLVSSFGPGFCDLTHRYAVFLSEKLFQQLHFSFISPIARSAFSVICPIKSSIRSFFGPVTPVQHLLNWFYIQAQSQSEEMNLMMPWSFKSITLMYRHVYFWGAVSDALDGWS